MEGGGPMSCFVTEKKAVCRVGEKMAAFYVFDTPQGVYLKPEIKLVDDWIKVAHRGDDSQGGVCKSGATRGLFPAQKIRRFAGVFLARRFLRR
ncbi:paREP2a [Pyrobaculum aerophilum str. IM2]|uniref:PaREP2a n=3 Tax=Pyrobaculum aerophilum TaxID=13773 RepID=Q8ZVL2_PYRAE|nr:PaRep2a protein [Pyrobaculum aerophilum]AAL64044.1 paREP2a [Pyrobaculum aerophilum str. IM2]